ncbi:MAG: PSD1 and planctomycete cytochrome C domain-containing protein [Verrucomicrobiota bacterium]
MVHCCIGNSLRQLSGRTFRTILGLVLFGATLSFARASEETLPSGGDLSFFENNIRPLLIENCYECHSEQANRSKGGLRLDTREALRRGGDSGPAMVPGKPDQSLLLKAISYRDSDLQMPPESRLGAHQIDLVRQWIQRGAPDPRADEKETGGKRKAGRDPTDPGDFWAFRPPTKAALPAVKDLNWPRRPLDHHLLAALETADLTPAPPASRKDFIRRATFDLHGLPPTPDEVAIFLTDNQPDAHARLIDRLLDSPRHGERWGRHWLDVARYSDSNGLDENMAYTSAFRYRDYVIDAFNRDKPYNRFIIEQLAGDLLPGAGENDPEPVIATGFLAVGPKMLACDDPQKMRMDIVDDQVDTTGRAFLGLTFGCARCHDHKFDPISAADYYGLAGIFKSTTTMVNYKVVAKWHEYDFSPGSVKALDARIAELQKEEKIKETAGARKNEIKTTISALENQRFRESVRVMAVREGKPEDTAVHLRGNYLTLGQTVPRRVPTVLGGEASPPVNPAASGRMELARHIASPDNPLTARVMVNRLWRWHFGTGIVPTVDNFGTLGQPPTNQPLLDHLALTFTNKNWSIKAMHREIMLSAAYRMSTRFSARGAATDPENKLLWRFPQRRLSAEEIHDSFLRISNGLDLTMHGQHLEDRPGKYVNAGKKAAYWKKPRRAVYLPVIRSGVYDAFVAFDFSDPSVLNGNRRTSTVAPQSLFLMNSDLVHESSQALGDRLGRDAMGTEARIQRLYALVYHRAPTKGEATSAASFLQNYEAEREKAWAALSRTLMASNEFLYVD